MTRLLFLDATSRAMYANWTKVAGDLVAYHRMISGKHPNDTAMSALVGELVTKDSTFASMWAEGRVGECISDTMDFDHPVAGAFTARFDLWAQASYPEHRIEIFDPDHAHLVIAALRSVPDAGLDVGVGSGLRSTPPIEGIDIRPAD